MKKIICILFVIAIIMISINNDKETLLIPEESIRFRIIANSNTKEDQSLKIKIKNDIQTKVFSKLDAESYDSADKIIKTNLLEIDKVLSTYNINYDVTYGQNYFPEKTYKGIIYPEGDYQSLVITLGEGIGDNWWCVLFPPLCLLEAEENNYEDVDYQFYVNKILNKFNH